MMGVTLPCALILGGPADRMRQCRPPDNKETETQPPNLDGVLMGATETWGLHAGFKTAM